MPLGVTVAERATFVHGDGTSRNRAAVGRPGSFDAIQRHAVQLLDDLVAGADGCDVGGGKQRYETPVERGFEERAARGERGGPPIPRLSATTSVDVDP